MGFRHISSDMKECGLRLWEAGWSTTDICSALCFSIASLYRWRSLLDQFGSVERPRAALCGRPRLIGMLAMTAIREVYFRHPDIYLDELQWFLAIHHDLAISKSALQENLEKAGLTRKILHKIAVERDEVQRQDFLHTIRTDFSGTGNEFVAIDESSKNDHTYDRRYGRSMQGQEAHIVGPFIRGQRYSMIAAMSKEGYLAAHVLPGSVDSFGFFDFIVEDVVSGLVLSIVLVLLYLFCRSRR
jgi:transposase